MTRPEEMSRWIVQSAILGIVILCISACAQATKPGAASSFSAASHSPPKVYERPDWEMPTNFAERDTYLSRSDQGDERFPSYVLTAALNVKSYKLPGWYPYGVDSGDTNLRFLTKKEWATNRDSYAAIDRLPPTSVSCLATTYQQCVRNLSAIFIVSTKIGEFQTFQTQQTDINGKPEYRTGSGSVLVLQLEETSFSWMRVKLTYSMKDGAVMAADIMPLDDASEFRLDALDAEENYRRTGIYPVLSVLTGGRFCDEISFYRFLHNDLVKKPRSSGDRFAAVGGVITRSDSTVYAAKTFCGYAFEYGRGSTESASARSYHSGDFEYLSVQK